MIILMIIMKISIFMNYEIKGKMTIIFSSLIKVLSIDLIVQLSITAVRCEDAVSCLQSQEDNTGEPNGQIRNCPS